MKILVKSTGEGYSTCKVCGAKYLWDCMTYKIPGKDGRYCSKCAPEVERRLIEAKKNCGEDSRCDECFAQINEDDCVFNHVEVEE